MYAIANIKGFQYKIEESKYLLIPKISKQDSDIISIKDIMLFKNNEKVLIGDPFIKDISVTAKIIEPLFKAKKVIVFKHKKRKRYRRKMGHRQKYTKILIEKINLT